MPGPKKRSGTTPRRAVSKARKAIAARRRKMPIVKPLKPKPKKRQPDIFGKPKSEKGRREPKDALWKAGQIAMQFIRQKYGF